jgi:hypothetical protein
MLVNPLNEYLSTPTVKTQSPSRGDDNGYLRSTAIARLANVSRSAITETK